MNIAKNKRVIFELILLTIILSQAYMNYWMYSLIRSESEVGDSGIDKDYICAGKISTLLEMQDKGDIDEMLNYGEELLTSGWGNDKTVLRIMAKANSFNGDKIKAIELLERAIQGEYICEVSKPTSKEFYDFEEAKTRHILSMLYKETGNEKKSNSEGKIAHLLAKESMGEKFDEQLFIKLCDNGTSGRSVNRENGVTP